MARVGHKATESIPTAVLADWCSALLLHSNTGNYLAQRATRLLSIDHARAEPRGKSLVDVVDAFCGPLPHCEAL